MVSTGRTDVWIAHMLAVAGSRQHAAGFTNLKKIRYMFYIEMKRETETGDLHSC